MTHNNIQENTLPSFYEGYDNTDGKNVIATIKLSTSGPMTPFWGVVFTIPVGKITNQGAFVCTRSKEDVGETTDKPNKISQDQDRTVDNIGLSLSEEDALKAQIFGCWSIPLGLPYNKDLKSR